jgi:hypothetical protein
MKSEMLKARVITYQLSPYTYSEPGNYQLPVFLKFSAKLAVNETALNEK